MIIRPEDQIRFPRPTVRDEDIHQLKGVFEQVKIENVLFHRNKPPRLSSEMSPNRVGQMMFFYASGTDFDMRKSVRQAKEFHVASSACTNFSLLVQGLLQNFLDATR